MNTKLINSIIVGTIILSAAATLAAAEISADFNRDIRPILAQNCFACHGPDEKSREAELRLDTAEGATADLGGYRALVPGKPDASKIVERIESDDPDEIMPPPDSGHKLTDAEKQLLRDWIADGGEYKVHWSFLPPKKTPLPNVKHAEWPRHAIDYFVLGKLESMGLTPEQESDRYRWLRRVSLDLTGLPPTIEQTDAFVADTSDDAYEKVVDQLLESDAYGEHWARRWLDLARYADTRGYEKDQPRVIWRYRDWVIAALNRDMPFDQFTREQLAGDLLPDATTSQILATAFHRNTMTNEEGGTDDEEFRVAAVKDRVDTTAQVWMGLTMGCAKCHSHKYDPISQRDYYTLFAFFNQTEDADRGNDSPLLATPTAKQTKQIAQLDAEIKTLEEKLKAEPEADLKPALENKRKTLAETKKAIPQTPIMRELPENKRRATKIHLRGNFLDQGEPVDAQVPSVFGAFPNDAPRNRLGVADWLMQEQNPLTARVTVNRVWARLFGTGIVETEEDFGTQGTPPSHPELLDWLAVDFRENDWSLKKLIRTIVLSSTYRQSATVSEQKLATDPRNRFLSRGPRFRLSGETVRDQALAASGLLSERIGGPSVMPPQPDGIWKTTYSALSWKDAIGPDRYRRGLYTYWKRTSPYPAMITFDAGSGEICLIRRVRTNTPLQALITLNDPVYIEAAGALASRMQQSSEKLADQIRTGFRLVLTRPPTEQESLRLLKLYQSMKQDFDADSESAENLTKAAGLKQGDAAMISVANVLLNLDETLMKP